VATTKLNMRGLTPDRVQMLVPAEGTGEPATASSGTTAVSGKHAVWR
jgi:hypothetical protein